MVLGFQQNFEKTQTCRLLSSSLFIHWHTWWYLTHFWGSLLFLHSFAFSSSDWIISVWLSLSSLIHFCPVQICYLALPIEIISVILFFNYKISVFFLKKLLYLHWYSIFYLTIFFYFPLIFSHGFIYFFKNIIAV